MTREIVLSRGKVALVDDEDFERCSALRWLARPALQTTENWYAFTSIKGASRWVTVYLHRFILDAPAGLFIDPINHDGLDCRRENLRLATPRENSINRIYDNPTGYRGVQRRGNSWRAILCSHGVQYRTPWCPSAVEAAEGYDRLARLHHGEFAVLNFPEAAAA